MILHLIVCKDVEPDGSVRYFTEDVFDAKQLAECGGSALIHKDMLARSYNAEVLIEVPDDTLSSAFPDAPLVQGVVL